jgi:hypothetical protein
VLTMTCPCCGRTFPVVEPPLPADPELGQLELELMAEGPPPVPKPWARWGGAKSDLRPWGERRPA